MSVEVGFWNVNNNNVKKINYRAIESERKLEEILENDISIISEELLLIGRQITTGFGKYIDMLALDIEGNMIVIELKKQRTPREVVAQVIDYASWVQKLSYKEIEELFETHNKNTLEEAFVDKFEVALPEEINLVHEMLIVSAELDEGTERIVEYLSSNYHVPINAIFFRYFKDAGNDYISRSWLIDPDDSEQRSAEVVKKDKKDAWNGTDFVVNFGDGESRSWEDARKYGFISAGNGKWYTSSLKHLSVGSRIFCMIPSNGYVGIGTVTSEATPLKKAKVMVNGEEVELKERDLKQPNFRHDINDLEKCEYVVGVDWQVAVDQEKAFWEKGLVANQNSAFKLRSQFTIDKVEGYFKVKK